MWIENKWITTFSLKKKKEYFCSVRNTTSETIYYNCFFSVKCNFLDRCIKKIADFLKEICLTGLHTYVSCKHFDQQMDEVLAFPYSFLCLICFYLRDVRESE